MWLIEVASGDYMEPTSACRLQLQIGCTVEDLATQQLAGSARCSPPPDRLGTAIRPLDRARNRIDKLIGLLHGSLGGLRLRRARLADAEPRVKPDHRLGRPPIGAAQHMHERRNQQ